MRSSIRAPPSRRRGMHRDPLPTTEPPPSTIKTQPKPDNTRIREENLAILSILSERFHLPDEISITIIDYSERWLAASFQSLHASPVLKIRSRSGEEASQEILHSSPITRETLQALRKITFNIRSHNQGAVGDPSRGNWSWFEAVLKNPAVEEKEDRRSHDILYNPLLSTEHEDYSLMTDNIVDLTGLAASPSPMEENCRLWEALRVGDCIILEGHVRYRAWENLVESASLTVWKVDDLMSDLPVEEDEVTKP
ncbi:hypothetical protein MMC14_005077 [Varicellaria rhodocarpa]|nr:hypothetical protein [Varicellaria rhodocarpa]